MLTLYDYYRSTACYRVRIALNYKNIPYKRQVVHLINHGGEQHQPDYRKINPQGLIPTIQAGDFTLSQSMAILEYLEEKYPKPNLLPKDPALRGQVRAFANIIACDIHPLNNLRVLQYLKNKLQISDEKKIQWYHHWLEKNFNAIETKLTIMRETKNINKNSPYCFGDQVSFADVCLVPQVYNAYRFNFSMDNYPFIVSINENCLQLPAFCDASPDMVK